MEHKKQELPVGHEQVQAAAAELRRFRRARASFENRVREEEKFFRMRVAPKAHKNAEGEVFAPTSAWLVNTVLQKHADMMENLPIATCLAREPGDVEDAKALSSILPVILERSEFESVYSENMWYKLKHGMCAFGVFWNNALDNGLGDIDVRRVDLSKLFWQPGVRRLQDSSAVYYLESVPEETLLAQFPHYNGKGTPASSMGLAATGEESGIAVVDRYYKKRLPDGRTVLHYYKFTGEQLLFASENDPAYERGWYEHGEYPFVLDLLYPIEGECEGFGYIALAKDPQLYIDRMDRNLMEYMDWATRVRYFCKRNSGVREEDFADLSRRIVEVEGDPDEERLRQITVASLDPVWLQLKNAKVEELKETTANRDFLQGAADGGVTAASAILALQEAGNKTVRDILSASYRSFVRLVRLVVECVRQFYSEERYFRILGKNGTYSYLAWSNKNMVEKECGVLADGTPAARRAIFDIDVRAEKKDPYTRYSHNEMMMELYRMGVFDKENAGAAAMLLSGMDFSGAATLRDRLNEQNQSV